MVMLSGERWHCTDPACQCVVFVEAKGQIQGTNPRCACGAIMKKSYSPPHMNYLDFLTHREPALSRSVPKEG
jgi:hypothetical protein